MTDVDPLAGANVLVSPSWLHSRLEEPSLRIVEIQYEPDIDEYADGHIPGAVNWYWKDMFWSDTEREFPTPQEMADRLGIAGIGPDTTVVLYSGRNQYAMYGYWVMKAMNGHPDVRVLDGGRTLWTREDLPMTSRVPIYRPVTYPSQRATRDDSARIYRDDVLDGLGRSGRVIVDARYVAEYEGARVKPGTGFDFGAERYGRIPGARHLLFRRFFNEDDTLKSRAELESEFRSVGAGPDQADEVVAYCRLSHRASSVWFVASQILGWDHVRVYDGSWTEWGSSVGLPIER